MVDSTLCDGIPPAAIIQDMLDKTATDRAVHAAMVARFDKQLVAFADELAKRTPGGSTTPTACWPCCATVW